MVNAGALAQAYLDCCHSNHKDKIAQVFDDTASYIDGVAGQCFAIPELVNYVNRLHVVLPNIEFQLTDFALSSDQHLLIRWRLNPTSVGSDVMNRLSPLGQDYTGMDYVQLSSAHSPVCKIKTAQSYYDSPSQLIVDSLDHAQEHRAARYQRHLLSDQQRQLVAAHLQQLLETKKYYLDAQLRLRDLADELSISTHQLSQVINEQFNKNFNEFINGYRISAAIDIMKTAATQHYTLLDIALASGFNSQAAFNPAFKKVTALTPSQYKKQVN